MRNELVRKRRGGLYRTQKDVRLVKVEIRNWIDDPHLASCLLSQKLIINNNNNKLVSKYL